VTGGQLRQIRPTARQEDGKILLGTSTAPLGSLQKSYADPEIGQKRLRGTYWVGPLSSGKTGALREGVVPCAARGQLTGVCIKPGNK